MALRTGAAIPLGSFADGEDLSGIFSVQVPLTVDIGGKIGHHVFLGGYLGVGIGGTGDGAVFCRPSNVSCATASFRLGIEVQYHFLPARFANPWIGYGIGYESSAIGISRPDGTGSYAGAGFELAHFMGGVDFRLGRVFGIGPFVDLSLAEFIHERVDTPGDPVRDGSISNTALHEWLFIGVRGVFFP